MKRDLVIHKNIKILADSGFQGLHKMHLKTELPFKKSKKKTLTTDQKKYNRQLAQKRVPRFAVAIEHKNRQFKNLG